jgi:hypothetical protein
MLKGLDLLSAHLLRYVSDLARLRGILTELLERLDVMAPTNRERAEDQLKTLVAQCNSCQLLCDEVTRKVQNMTTMVSLRESPHFDLEMGGCG